MNFTQFIKAHQSQYSRRKISCIQSSFYHFPRHYTWRISHNKRNSYCIIIRATFINSHVIIKHVSMIGCKNNYRIISQTIIIQIFQDFSNIVIYTFNHSKIIPDIFRNKFFCLSFSPYPPSRTSIKQLFSICRWVGNFNFSILWYVRFLAQIRWMRVGNRQHHTKRTIITFFQQFNDFICQKVSTVFISIIPFFILIGDVYSIGFFFHLIPLLVICLKHIVSILPPKRKARLVVHSARNFRNSCQMPFANVSSRISIFRKYISKSHEIWIHWHTIDRRPCSSRIKSSLEWRPGRCWYRCGSEKVQT